MRRPVDTPEVSRRYRRWLTPMLLIAITAGPVLLGAASDSPVIVGATTTAGVGVIFAVGLYTFVGTTGIISFGHMGLVTLGAYVAAICASDVALKMMTFTGMPHWMASIHLAFAPAVLLGAIAASLLALVIALPLMRLTALAASLASFAALIVVNSVASNLDSITGGVSGFSVAPISTTPYAALVAALAVIGVGFFFKESRIGLRLRASRDDEAAARGVGANVHRDRVIAFMLSGFLVGIGGGLSALQTGGFTPSAFFLDATLLVLVMIVVGGVNSLSGAVVGSLLVSVIVYVLQQAQSGSVFGLFSFTGRPGIETAGLAVVVLLMLVFRPSGLFGYTEIGDVAWRFLRQPGGMDASPMPKGTKARNLDDGGDG